MTACSGLLRTPRLLILQRLVKCLYFALIANYSQLMGLVERSRTPANRVLVMPLVSGAPHACGSPCPAPRYSARNLHPAVPRCWFWVRQLGEGAPPTGPREWACATKRMATPHPTPRTQLRLQLKSNIRPKRDLQCTMRISVYIA